MLRNRKGFVIEGMAVVWVVASLVIGAVAFFQGPQIVKAIRGGDRNEQKAVHKIDKTRTYFELDEKTGDYKPSFVDKTSEYSTEMEKITPPETLWEKFWHLGWMAVATIAVITGIIIFLGAGPLVMRWINKLRAKIAEMGQAEEDLTADARKIVLSIDEGLATMEANIKAAQTMADATTDVNVKQSYTTIVLALQDMRTDFLTALSKKQDSTTKLLVRELKND
jgi:hypothetical protein